MEIEVFHDTVCPWCRIGKRHLALALQDWQGPPVAVVYRAFFLDPGIPAEGRDFRTHMLAKGGGRVPLQRFFDGPRRSGAAAGLTFNFERIERAPNTLLSHRLIALAPHGQQEAVIDALYAAYFEHGRDIGDLETLVQIGLAGGLDAAETRQRLLGDAGQAQVLAEVRQAQALGISGVPFYLIDRKYAFSGAQPPEVMRRALLRVAAELHPQENTH